jgi:hypothetical protein
LKPKSSVLSVGHAAFHAAAGHPHRETVGIVVAPVPVFGNGGAAEFSAPDHEGVLEEAALFEIFEQGVDGTIDVRGELAGLLVVFAVGVPGLAVAVVDLDETHPALGEAAGKEAAVREVAGAVGFADLFGLFGKVKGIARLELHAVGGLHRLDAAFEGFLTGGARGEMFAVEGGGEIELAALGGGIGFRRAEPGDHAVGLEL